MMIRIYTQEEAREGAMGSGGGGTGSGISSGGEVSIEASGTGSIADGGAQAGSQTADGKVDLNTATLAELMTLPGIGEAKAKSILGYREETGDFSSIEDIMKVTGIKEGLFNQIRDFIKVN